MVKILKIKAEDNSTRGEYIVRGTTFCLYLMNEMRRNLMNFFFFCISNTIKTIDLPSFTGFTIDNNIHEKITQFWLARVTEEMHSFLSANL